MHNDKFYDLIKGIDPLEKKKEVNEHTSDTMQRYLDTTSSQEKKRGGFADNVNETAINELSKNTLYSYIKKAKNSKKESDKNISKAAKSGVDSDTLNKDFQTSTKRQKVGLARKKLATENIEFSEEELQMIANIITEEEFEQLDELSKKTLGSYAKEASADAGTHRVRAATDIMSNKLMSSKTLRKIYNRSKGVDRAINKLTKEDTNEEIVEGIFSEDEIAALLEMEQLDELSKETLKSYVAKNKADPVRIKKRGPTTKAQKAGIAKRDAGHEVASSKLAKIHKKESDAAFAAHANKVHEASNRFMKAAHDHLTDKGYTFHGEHKHEGAVYSKYHPHNGVLNTYKVKRGDGIHSNPSIVHTSIQGHSYSGNSPHHHRVSIFQDHENEHSHENIAAGVHKYVDSTEHDSHHDVSRDHHWKDEQAKKNK